MNILINGARRDVERESIHGEIVARLKDKVGNVSPFNVLVDPSGDIPEQTRPTIVILGPRHLANPQTINSNTQPVIEKIAGKRGNIERIYRNTIIFLICSEPGYAKLKDHLTEFNSIGHELKYTNFIKAENCILFDNEDNKFLDLA